MELKYVTRLTWNDLPGIEVPFFARRAVGDDFLAARSFCGIHRIFGMDEAIGDYYRLFLPYGSQTEPKHVLGWLLEMVGSGRYPLNLHGFRRDVSDGAGAALAHGKQPRLPSASRG